MAADEKPGAGFCFVADYQAGIQHGLGKPRPGPPGSSRRAGGSSSVLRPTRARVDSWLFGYSIVPKDGVTPALSGRIPLVLTGASLWGQKLDRLEGVLAFEKGRIVIENATARLPGGTPRGGGL